MKVVHLNYYDISGGAARAAHRIHTGLRQAGVDSRMLVVEKKSQDLNVRYSHNQAPGVSARLINKFLNLWVTTIFNLDRSALSNTLFSSCFKSAFDLEILKKENPDIINLHWTAGQISYENFSDILNLNIPIVWTLHDQLPFTGGCHYSAGCKKYLATCSDCPQLILDLTKAPLLQQNLKVQDKEALTVITPSQWLTSCASSSRVFRHIPCHTIANGIDTKEYLPMAPSIAREQLGIDANDFVILFGADSGLEHRKGAQLLIEALSIVHRDLRGSPQPRDIRVLVFGTPPDDLEKMGIQATQLGYLRSDAELARAYSAADLTALPSYEDNLPNIILESFSCGTPVIGFNIGGLPDFIVSGKTGELAIPYDTIDLARKIISLYQNESLLRQMRSTCRKVAEQSFAIETTAKNYQDLYSHLIEKNRNKMKDSKTSGKSTIIGFIAKNALFVPFLLFLVAIKKLKQLK